MAETGEHEFALQVRARTLQGIADFDWTSLTSGVAVLTGRNNVGKSRLLRTIGSLGAATSEPTPRRLLEVRVREDQYAIEMATDETGHPHHYQTQQPDGSLLVVNWEKGGNNWSQRVAPPETAGGGTYTVYGPNKPILAAARSLPEYARLASALQKLVYLPPLRHIPSTVATVPATVPMPTGEDLARVMYTHSSGRTTQFDQIQHVMQSMYPEIDAILTPATAVNQVTLMYRDRFSGLDVSLEEAGTGVGQVLHIVASVLLHPPGRIFLIDEPHAYLHPMVERLLVQFLREHDEHWYVCATHSPVFINAARPEHTWLVTRSDPRGTRLQSVFEERLTRRDVLTQLGIRPGDVAFAERTIFVEGDTEERAFPMLLERLGWDPVRSNCSVISLGGTSHTEPFAKTALALDDLLGVNFTICLDGDAKAKYSYLPNVRFLPVQDFEELLLDDAHAIRDALLEDFDDPDLAARDEVESTWPVDRVAEYIDVRRRNKPGLSAAKVLGELAREMGTDYQKTLHGPRIAALLRNDVVERLRATFEDFFATAQSGE